MTRVSFAEMKSTIKRAFMAAGMSEVKADVCAGIHAESSRDGVYSHGLNRVERFVDYLIRGLVVADADPSLVSKPGAMEVYDGNMGPGILNAVFAMNRASEIAQKNGLGLVTLNNTTHWMRGGTYGWQAAESGYIGICWTNTESCMPPWGAQSCAVGNNPFIMAVPRKEGHIVLDMAMSQYSYGKLQVTRLNNKKLPYPGGFDKNGHLTDDPAAIEETRRILPVGYWKGSAFSIMLDLVAALLSGGFCTSGIDKLNRGSCGSCSQVFIAIDPLKNNSQDFVDHILDETIGQLKSSVPADDNESIYYPGEQSLKTRKENMSLGIPVDADIWSRVKSLATL